MVKKARGRYVNCVTSIVCHWLVSVSGTSVLSLHSSKCMWHVKEDASPTDFTGFSPFCPLLYFSSLFKLSVLPRRHLSAVFCRRNLLPSVVIILLITLKPLCWANVHHWTPDDQAKHQNRANSANAHLKPADLAWDVNCRDLVAASRLVGRDTDALPALILTQKR